MNKRSIIIIGAGIGGLATGCYAQMNGYQTQIFEQCNKPGGLAAMWRRKDYLIDGGIHFLSGHKPEIEFYNILKEVGADKCNYIDMKTYTRFIDEASGIRIDITTDLLKLKQDLLSLFPEDNQIINEIINSAQDLSKVDLSIYGMEKPAELLGFKDKIKDYWAVKGVWKYFIGKYNKEVRKISNDLHNPLLGEFLAYIFLPDVPFWFVLMILSMISTNQMCLLGDGSFGFAKAIEKRYCELGGVINYSSNVKSILVENNCVKGIELENGNIFKSDYTVSAADGYHTIFELLKGHYSSQEIEKRFCEKNLLPPCILISIGVKREFKNEPWLNIIKLEQPFYFSNVEVRELTLRIFNYSNNFAASGKTVIQILIETDWNFWEHLRNTSKVEYDTKKEELAQKIISILENHFIGISQEIEIIDVATPITFWRYTRSYKGSIMGFLPTAKQMMKVFKKTLPNLKNLYTAGQWSMPIGGVAPSIFSGRHVVQLICKNDSKNFITKIL